MIDQFAHSGKRHMARHKPKTPQQITAERVAASVRAAKRREADRLVKKREDAGPGIALDTLTLEANADVQATQKTGRTHARRTSWMDRILVEKSQESRAVHRLADLIAVRKGEGDSPESSGGSGSRELVNDAMIKAARQLDEVLGYMGRRDAVVIVQLIDPTCIFTAGVVDWKVTVQRFTGEEDRKRQAAIVQNIARNLVSAWEEFDYS
jgi:hypothetical protein